MKKLKKAKHSDFCRCGVPKDPLPEDHPWYVNAPEYHNCFWNYLKNNTRPHTLKQVANLVGFHISSITSIEKRGLKKLKRKIQANEAKVRKSE